ncbi:MAG: hypothetical protein LKF36_11975 [Lactobacillus sp.]|nr:hypothetical protein [Lactobacillus sp.]
MDNNYVEQKVTAKAIQELSLQLGQAIFEKAQLSAQIEALQKENEKLKQEADKDESENN